MEHQVHTLLLIKRAECESGPDHSYLLSSSSHATLKSQTLITLSQLEAIPLLSPQ